MEERIEETRIEFEGTFEGWLPISLTHAARCKMRLIQPATFEVRRDFSSEKREEGGDPPSGGINDRCNRNLVKARLPARFTILLSSFRYYLRKWNPL